MDKILQSVGGGRGGGSDVSVTNDGATILRSIHVDNAAAKVWSLSASCDFTLLVSFLNPSSRSW